MTTIRPLTDADRDEWLPLWHAYLEFYESELEDGVTDVVFRRLVAGDGVHGALARDATGRAIGFVHWLLHPSTWSIAPYCYLEDLFVRPEERGAGIGRRLLSELARIAVARKCGRMEWSVLDWNPAREFYFKLGAKAMDAWTVFRMTPEAFGRLARAHPPTSRS